MANTDYNWANSQHTAAQNKIQSDQNPRIVKGTECVYYENIIDYALDLICEKCSNITNNTINKPNTQLSDEFDNRGYCTAEHDKSEYSECIYGNLIDPNIEPYRGWWAGPLDSDGRSLDPHLVKAGHLSVQNITSIIGTTYPIYINPSDVTRNEIKNQLNNYLSYYGMTSKKNTIMTTKSILQIFSYISLFITKRLVVYKSLNKHIYNDNTHTTKNNKTYYIFYIKNTKTFLTAQYNKKNTKIPNNINELIPLSEILNNNKTINNYEDNYLPISLTNLINNSDLTAVMDSIDWNPVPWTTASKNELSVITNPGVSKQQESASVNDIFNAFTELNNINPNILVVSFTSSSSSSSCSCSCSSCSCSSSSSSCSSSSSSYIVYMLL